MPKLAALCGSLRAASFNRSLMQEAMRAWDGEAEEVSLRFPLYDGDLEEAEGIPAVVQTAADQIAAADAVLVVTPEYNKGISGALKNALDWISRTEGNPWADKPVALMSAAAGRAGGERSQWNLRHALTPFSPRLLYGPEVLVGNASGQFDEDRNLTNEINLKTVKALMEKLREASAS